MIPGSYSNLLQSFIAYSPHKGPAKAPSLASPPPDLTEKAVKLTELVNARKPPEANRAVPSTPTFLDRCWILFVRLLRWLGFEIAEEDQHRAKMLYGMNLFKNYDPSMTGRNKQAGFSLPLVTALKEKRAFLQSIGADSGTIEAMDQCASYAEKMAEAQNVSILARGKIVGEVGREIITKVEALEEGGKLYFPAGLKLTTDAADTQTHGIICQITKNTEGAIDLQMFYDSEKVDALVQGDAGGQNISPRYTLTQDQFRTDLPILLEALAVSSNHSNMGLWEKMRLKFSLADRAGRFMGQAPLPKKAEATSEKLKQLFKERAESRVQEGAADAPRKLRPQGDATRLLQTFSKKLGDPDAGYAQLAERTMLFLDIYDQRDPNDIAMNRWLAASAKMVIQNITKFFRVTGAQDDRAIDDILQTLLEKFKVITEDLEKKNEAAKQSETAAVVPEKKSGHSFDEKVISTQPLIPLKKCTLVERNGPAKLAPPFEPIDFAHDDIESILRRLRKCIKECEGLSKKRRLDQLNFRIAELQTFMEAADQAKMWERIPQGHHAAFASVLNHLTVYHAQVHFGMNKSGPLPRVMLQLFKNLQRAQMLAHANDDATAFRGFTLDMAPFREILQDPWLSLGGFGHELFTTLDSFETEGSARVDFTNPNGIDIQSAADQQFFKAFAAKKNIQGQEEALCTAFSPGSKTLDIQIVYLRRMKVLMLMMMARHNTLVAAGLMENVRDAVNLGMNTIGLQNVDLKQQRLVRQHASINRKLHKTSKPKSIEINHPWTDGRRTLHIAPYGVDFTGYHPGPSPFPSQYMKTAQEVSPFVAHLIDPSGADWKTVFDQLAVQTGFPSDILEELRNMQDSSTELRILKSLNLFANHPHLLADPYQGMSFQRLLTLNLLSSKSVGWLLQSDKNLHLLILARLEKMREELLTNGNIREALFVNTLVQNILKLSFVGEAAPENIQSHLQHFKRNHQLKHDHILEQLSRANESFAGNRGSIHHYILLQYAMGGQEPVAQMSVEELTRLIAFHFIIKQTPPPAHERNRQEEELITLFMHRIFLQCEKTLTKEDWNRLINGLIEGNQSADWDRMDDTLTFKNQESMIDLVNGTYSKNHVRLCYLPESIAQSVDCNAVFGVPNLSNIPAERFDILYEEKHGPLYHFTLNNCAYKIILLPGQQTLVYKMFDKEWYQLHYLFSEGAEQRIPSDLLDKISWVSPRGDRLIVEEPSTGQKLFDCNLHSGQKYSADHLVGHSFRLGAAKGVDGIQLLNPWSQPEFAHFLKITPPNKVRALGVGDKVEKIQYTDASFGYRWDPAKGKWYSLEYPNHYLSQKRIEEVIDSGNMYVPGSIFNTHFSNYHILDSETENPKLVIPRCSYEKSQKTKLNKSALHTLTPLYSKDSSLVDIFDLEPDGTIKGDSVEAYLNLAYLFFSQGKYDRALEYIHLIQNMPMMNSTESLQILSRFERSECTSRKGKIVLLHLKIYLLDQHELNATTEINDNIFLKRLNDLVERYKDYLEWENKRLIPQNLHLTRNQRTRVNIFFATVSQANRMLRSLPQDELQLLVLRLKEIMNDEKRRTESLARNPENEIETATWAYTKRSIILECHIKRSSFLLRDSTPLFHDDQTAEFDAKKAILHEAIAISKNKILSLINNPASKRSEWERLADTLKRPYQSDDRFFNKMIQSCASNEWEELTAANIVQFDAIAQIRKAAVDYLVATTTLTVLKNMKAGGGALPKREYTPHDHPLALQLLLLEHHLGRLATRSEVQSFLQLAEHASPVLPDKLEPDSRAAVLAATTSYQAAQGKVPALILESESTDAAAHILAVAYGKGIYRLQCNSNSPTDSLTLKILLRNLWKTAAMGNILQIEISDLRCLNAALKAKEFEQRQSDLSDDRRSEINKEIAVIKDIFGFLKERVDLTCETLPPDDGQSKETRDLLGWFKSVSRLREAPRANDSEDLSGDDTGDNAIDGSGEKTRAVEALLKNIGVQTYPRKELLQPEPEWQDLGITDLDSLVTALQQQDQQHFRKGGKEIYISPNLAQADGLPIPLFGPVSTRNPLIDRIMVLVNPESTDDQVMILMGSETDFRNYLLALDKQENRSPYSCYIYNLDHDDFEGKLMSLPDTYSPELKEKIALGIAKVKLLTGKFNAAVEDTVHPLRNAVDRAMEKWLKKKTNKRKLIPAEIEAKFIKFLQLYRPSVLPFYERSRLAKTFKVCKGLYCKKRN